MHSKINIGCLTKTTGPPREAAIALTRGLISLGDIMFAVGALKASGTYGAPYQPAIRATSAYGSRRDGHELCPLVSSSYGPCNEGRSTFSLTFSSPGTFRVFPLSPRFPSVALGPAVMRFLSCLVCSPLFVSTAGPFCGSLIDEMACCQGRGGPCSTHFIN